MVPKNHLFMQNKMPLTTYKTKKKILQFASILLVLVGLGRMTIIPASSYYFLLKEQFDFDTFVQMIQYSSLFILSGLLIFICGILSFRKPIPFLSIGGIVYLVGTTYNIFTQSNPGFTEIVISMLFLLYIARGIIVSYQIQHIPLESNEELIDNEPY
jgi:hypothetical protein